MNDLEHAVRTSLSAIADDAGPPSGLTTAEQAIARHGRDRRRRAGLWATAAAAVVVAAVVPTALGAWTPGPDRNVAATAIDSQESTPSAAEPEPASAPPPGDVLTGAAAPELGVAYPFDLLTHCGIRWTSFAGRDWKAVSPVSEPADLPADLPGPDGITTSDYYTGGTMTLVEEDLLRFTVTAQYVDGGGRTFDFVPMTATDPRPLCE